MAYGEIPFTVGGGINELSDIDRMLGAGADKVSINSAALRRPELIDEIARNFGSQVCVTAIDARLEDDGEWWCYVNGGRIRTERRLDHLEQVLAQRAGEGFFKQAHILLLLLLHQKADALVYI